jgi:hypothetical protein
MIAGIVVFTIICAWVALARYDKKHPPEDREPDRRPEALRRR